MAQDKHPYEWVDEAITIIQKSDLKYEIRPFATELEGSYEQVDEDERRHVPLLKDTQSTEKEEHPHRELTNNKNRSTAN